MHYRLGSNTLEPRELKLYSGCCHAPDIFQTKLPLFSLKNAQNVQNPWCFSSSQTSASDGILNFLWIGFIDLDRNTNKLYIYKREIQLYNSGRWFRHFQRTKKPTSPHFLVTVFPIIWTSTGGFNASLPPHSQHVHDHAILYIIEQDDETPLQFSIDFLQCSAWCIHSLHFSADFLQCSALPGPL